MTLKDKIEKQWLRHMPKNESSHVSKSHPSTKWNIAVYVDHFTKQVHVLPINETITAEGVAEMHMKEIFWLHRIPWKIFSDREAVFAAQVTKALYKQLGTNIGLTTAYHPAANRQVKQKNQDTEQFLWMFVKQRQDDWADLLPIAEFVLNSRKTSATDHTPFELNYGYTSDSTIPVGKASNMPLVNQRLQKLWQVRKEAEDALKLRKERMKENYEKEKKKAHQFEVGDLVWLDSKEIKIY